MPQTLLIMSDNSDSCAHIVTKPSESPSIHGKSAPYDRKNQGYIFATIHQKGIALSERSQTHKNHTLCYSLVWFFFFSGTGDPRGPEIWSVTFRWWTWTLSTLILCIYPKGAGHNLEDDENGFYLILVVGTQKYIFDKIHWTLYLKKGDFRYMCVQSCPTFCDPWTAAHQAPLFPEFSMQEYWSGLPFPSPGDLPDPEIYKLYFTNPDLSVSLSFLSVSLFFSSLSPTHTHTHTDT